jgi:hypothetical protein
LLAALATLLLAFVNALPAFAAPPEFQTVPLDVTFVDQNATNQCGFPVQIHLLGTMKISIHNRRDGTVVEIDQLLHFSVISTNLETNTSNTSIAAGPSILTTEADGTITIAGLAIFDVVTVPGQGLLIKDVGRLVTDANGNVIFEAGTHPIITGGDVQGLCTALS